MARASGERSAWRCVFSGPDRSFGEVVVCRWRGVGGSPPTPVMARCCGLRLVALAGFSGCVYVGWLPLKFFVAPVSRLVFLAREVVEGLTRNVELGSIEGCR